MENNTHIMAMPSNEQPEIMVEEQNIELIVARAEKMLDARRRLVLVAIKHTKPTDWIEQNNQPYLTASGCDKIAIVFGVEIGKPEYPQGKREEREDDKGKYYIYTFTAMFKLKNGSSRPAVGSCSSRDKFFSWDGTKKEWKPLSETDETNIQKAAFSNMISNGIKSILGLKGIGWEDLEAAGIKREELNKVEYNKGANADPKAAGLISEAQIKRLYAISKEAGYKEDEFKAWLEKSFGFKSTKEIPWKQYDNICKKVVEDKKK